MRSWNDEYLGRGTAGAIALSLHVVFAYALLDHLVARRIPEPRLQEPLFATIMSVPQDALADLKPVETRPDLATLRIQWPADVEPIFPVEEPAERLPPISADAPPVVAAESPPGGTSETQGEGADLVVFHRVQPVYPPQSIRAREEGTVVIGALVDERGRPRKIKFLHSSGFERLDRSAAHAVRQWLFAPATDAARSEGEWTTVKVAFHLVPADLAPTPITLVPFDAAIANRINSAVRAKEADDASRAQSEAALRGIIEKLRVLRSDDRGPDVGRVAENTAVSTGESEQGDASIAPLQKLAAWGEVQSIEFVGVGDKGIDTDEPTHRDGAAGSRGVEPVRWHIYKVKQKRGSSEWLLAISPTGETRNVQAMTGLR